jgi:PAS domain S-box-containing protein
MSDAVWDVLQAGPVGAVLVDRDGVICAVNAPARTCLGMEAANAVGRRAIELIDQAHHLEAVHVPTDHGAVLYLTDRSREQALESELAHRKAIAATIRDAVIETDADFAIRSWNHGAERMYGWTEEEVLGRSTVEVLKTQIRDAEVATVVAELNSQGHVLTLATQETRAGDAIVVEASVIALPDEHGRQTGYVTINRDVSRRRRLEERLLETRHLEVAARLAGGVAHDLNSQLTAILGFADLSLADPRLPEWLRPDLRQIVVAAERSGELTRQLLAFSRQQVLTPRALDLNDIVARGLDAGRRLAGKRVELVNRPGADLPLVLMDPMLLEQVLLDVIANAGEAMPDGGRLVVESAKAEIDGPAGGSFVRLTITDTGTGMDEYIRARAFEPFFTTKPDHTGLGLSTVYGTIGQSGGRVTLDSSPGTGTTVTLFLPRA